MAVNLFQEISRHSVELSRYEDVDMVWCNSYLAIHADRTIRILEFQYNLQCTDKKIDCVEYCIKVPQTSTASKLFNNINGSIIKGLDLAQMSVDPALWPHSKYVLREMCDFAAMEWSPESLMWNNDYILATLTNVGHVQFYRRQRKSWIVALNVSTLIAKQFPEVIEEHSADKTLEALSECVHTLESSAICWSTTENEDGSVYFVTAQKNGIFIFWTITEIENDIEAKYVSQVNTSLHDIVKIMWIPKGSRVLLLCSNIQGQVFLIDCQINDSKQITMLNTHLLWSHTDRMIVKYCNYMLVENKIIYICNKYRHLLIQVISEDCKVLSQSINNINDHKISSISLHKNDFYVTTVNGCMYKVNYEIINESLDVQFQILNIKDVNPSCELHSGTLSKNGALLMLGLVDRSILYRKKHMTTNIVYYAAAEADFPEFLLLLNNPSKNLSKHWDCVETLRYKIIKCRRLPDYNYNQLLSEGESDVYKLKLYLIILVIYEVLIDNFKINKGALPENSVELVKEKIAKSHAKTLIQNLYNRYIVTNSLTDFEAECFAGGKRYLEVINKKHDTKLDIPENVLNIVNIDYNYICQSCEKTLIGFSCEDGHLNAFCSLTFTPIEDDDYFVCKGCGAIARLELYKEKPMCIYCDLYFEHT